VAINIRNREAEELARELAKVTGDSITGAVVVALRERLASVRGSSPSGTSIEAERLSQLRAISADAAKRWSIEQGSIDHAALLYDERGFPA
jgi:antitoxin VapB